MKDQSLGRWLGAAPFRGVRFRECEVQREVAIWKANFWNLNFQSLEKP